MNIERLINELARNFAKTALNKQEESSETINLNDIGSGDLLKITLKRLANNGEYNKAENMLFETINKNNSEEIYEIALGFYDSLLKKSDEELKAGNFTREEVYQGMTDIKRIYGK